MTVYWIDLFCGAGGTTTGIHLSSANAKVLACVNHDAEAIKAHQTNHPECVHFTEDVRNWNVIFRLKAIVEELREKEPECTINIWASLECTHFSKAKGGLARDADSRTLADHLFYYVKVLQPQYLYIENVEEFLTWGPVDEDGKPIKELRGIDYERWRKTLNREGYDYDYQLLNSADFGAYTSRKRYFGIFAQSGLPICFPETTHSKKGSNGKSQWKAVKDVLDFSIEGNSIFDLNMNGKQYSVNTLERIYGGLIKFNDIFIKRYNGGNPLNKSQSIEKPIGSLLTNRTHALIKPCFLTSYYGNGDAHTVEAPCNTLTTKERYAAHFIGYDYSTLTTSSIDSVAGTITTNPKHNLTTAKFTMDHQFNNTGRSIEKPGQTLIARMDKSPIYLVEASEIKDRSIDSPDDRPIELKIKKFMREQGILDITIRMLTIAELKAIQGFPEDYVLTGSKTAQLKFIGNSVVPLMAGMLVEANYHALLSVAA